MDEFSVRVQQLFRESDDITKIARRIQEIGNVVSSVQYRLDWDVKQRAQISATLSKIRNNTVTLSSKTNIMGKKLESCARKYDSSENRIVSNGNVKGSEKPGGGIHPPIIPSPWIPWMPRIIDIIRPYIPRIILPPPPLRPGFGNGRKWELYRFVIAPINYTSLVWVGTKKWNPSELSKSLIPQVISAGMGGR